MGGRGGRGGAHRRRSARRSMLRRSPAAAQPRARHRRARARCTRAGRSSTPRRRSAARRAAAPRRRRGWWRRVSGARAVAFLIDRCFEKVRLVPEDYFGERVAERYDESAADRFDPAVVGPTVDFLAALAGAGAALELGIGTGRIALPLAERGVQVHGIDLSEAMVAKLEAKPGAERIGVTIGDFATTRVEGTFALAYLVFNTINNLTTQVAQVACFENVAEHLEPGGCFAIEVGVPTGN